MDETIIYRMIRYFTILTWEHYQTQVYLADRFNKPLPKAFTIEEIAENICKDFGLSYKVFKEHSDLEKH